MLALFWVHTVSVTPLLGVTPTGRAYGDPVTVSCFVDDTTKLVIASSGEQIASTTTVFADSSLTALFPLDSLVTVGARTARVVSVNNCTSGPLGLPDHVEIALL